MRQVCWLLVFGCLWYAGTRSSVCVADDAAGHAVTDHDEGGHASSDSDHAGSDHAEAGDHAHAHHHAHIGEKDVDTDPLSFRTDLAIFTLIVFLLLFFGLKQLAWPAITAALDQREASIRQAAADAEAARQQAQALLREHQGRMEAIQDEVKEIIAEARRDAERTKADIVAFAENEAQLLKDRALGEIARAKDQALNELFERMASQVAAATEHVVGKGISIADQQQLIDEALREFASQSA